MSAEPAAAAAAGRRASLETESSSKPAAPPAAATAAAAPTSTPSAPSSARGAAGSPGPAHSNRRAAAAASNRTAAAAAAGLREVRTPPPAAAAAPAAAGASAVADASDSADADADGADGDDDDAPATANGAVRRRGAAVDDDDDAEAHSAEPSTSRLTESQQSQSQSQAAHASPRKVVTAADLTHETVDEALQFRINLAVFIFCLFFIMIFFSNGDGLVITGALLLSAVALLGLRGAFRFDTAFLHYCAYGLWGAIAVLLLAVGAYLGVNTTQPFAAARCSLSVPAFVSSYGVNCTSANSYQPCYDQCMSSVEQQLAIESGILTVVCAIVLFYMAYSSNRLAGRIDAQTAAPVV